MCTLPAGNIVENRFAAVARALPFLTIVQIFDRKLIHIVVETSEKISCWSTWMNVLDGQQSIKEEQRMADVGETKGFASVNGLRRVAHESPLPRASTDPVYDSFRDTNVSALERVVLNAYPPPQDRLGSVLVSPIQGTK
eukprot:scaffold370_cov349-Pavlova_lutheri.AAC.39